MGCHSVGLPKKPSDKHQIQHRNQIIILLVLIGLTLAKPILNSVATHKAGELATLAERKHLAILSKWAQEKIHTDSEGEEPNPLFRPLPCQKSHHSTEFGGRHSAIENENLAISTTKGQYYTVDSKTSCYFMNELPREMLPSLDARNLKPATVALTSPQLPPFGKDDPFDPRENF